MEKLAFILLTLFSLLMVASMMTDARPNPGSMAGVVGDNREDAYMSGPRKNIVLYGEDLKPRKNSLLYGEEFGPRKNVRLYGGDEDNNEEKVARMMTDARPNPGSMAKVDGYNCEPMSDKNNKTTDAYKIGQRENSLVNGRDNNEDVNGIFADKNRGMDQQEHVHPHAHPIDPSQHVFFTISDVFVGNVMPIYFPKRDLSSLHFIPKEEAEKIPFSLGKLPYLLHLFSFQENSPQAIAMSDTLRQCETPAIEGEKKFCATSKESMFDFVTGIFGLGIDDLNVKTTTHITTQKTLLQNYTFVEILEDIWVPRMVACHSMPYAYTIVYCHTEKSKSRVFKILVQGENGDLVKALSLCHTDTSHWSPNHKSFAILGIERGTVPVCHFFDADALLWTATKLI